MRKKEEEEENKNIRKIFFSTEIRTRDLRHPIA